MDDELNANLLDVNSKVRNVLSKVILAIDFTNTSRQDFQYLQIDSYRKRGFALTSFVGATDDDYYKIANFYQEHTDGIQVYGAAAQFDGAAPYNLNSDVFYADQCKEVDSLIEGEGNIGNVFKVVVTDGQSCHPIDNSIPHTTIETDYDLLSKNTGFLTENAQYDNDNNADLNKALDKQTYIMGLIVEPFNKSKAFGKNTLINYIQDVLIVLQGSPKKVILKKHADNLEDNGDNQMIKQISDSLVNGDTLNTFITDLTNNSNNKVIMSSVLSALLKIDNIPAPTKKNKNKKLDIFNKKTQPIIIGTNDVIIQLEDDDNDPTLLNKSYQGQITSPYTPAVPAFRSNKRRDRRYSRGESRGGIFDQEGVSSGNTTDNILEYGYSNDTVIDTSNKHNILQSPPKGNNNKYHAESQPQDSMNMFNFVNDSSSSPVIPRDSNKITGEFTGGKSKKKRSRKNRNKNKKTQKPRFTRNKSLKIKHKRTKKNLNHKTSPQKN